MAFDNTKYDIELNSVGYRINGYRKTEFSPFIPRFSSGDQPDSEFDLLRAKTVKGFSGGILQRNWEDDTSVFATEGLYPVYDDGTLYPVSALSTVSGWLGKSQVTAHVRTKDYFFYATQSYNTPTNNIYRVDSSGTITALTLPASISTPGGALEKVSSMVVWNGFLMVAMTDGSVLGQMNIQSTTTVTDITSGSTIDPYLLTVWNGQLYMTNATTNAIHSVLYRYTGTTSSKSWVEVGRVPSYITSFAIGDSREYSSKLFVFNNRIMMTRLDGLWAYDGIRVYPFEDLIGNEDYRNYSHACVLKGYLYYFMPDGFYRTNGTLIEKLYDVSECGFPVDAITAKNRIWILYSNSGYSANVSRYDKSMGYDYSSSNDIAGRVAVFDGKSMYTYGRSTIFVKNPATIDFAGQSEVHRIWFCNNKIHIGRYYDKNGTGHDEVSVDELSNTGNKSWSMVTSIYDGDFPMIDKNLDSLEYTFDGTVSADQDITLEYRTAGFDGSTGWTSLGTIKTQTRVKEYIFRATPGGITFRKIQFRMSATSAASYGLAKFIMRFNLSPDMKWQWEFVAKCYGDSATEPLLLRDMTVSTQAVQLLRGNIYSARMSDVPVKFVDLDSLDLDGAHNNSTTTLTLLHTGLLKESGFVQVDDEIIYYTGKTSTTLTGCIRASLGTSAASHSSGAKVFPVYRVFIRQIRNERIEITDNDPDSTSGKARASDISLLLQEV